VIDEMRVVARSRDLCWGTLALYRTAPSGSPFTERDAHVVAQSAALIADLLRLSLLRAAVETPDVIEQPPGLLLVAADGAIEATTHRAAAWLDALADRTRGPSAVRVVARAAMAGDGLARAALAARDGRCIELHSSVRRDADGEAAGPVEVIIEGARPVQLSDVIARAHGFTTREREVAGMIVRGRTTAEMSEVLGVSDVMVRDHARAVFAKTHTAGRGELAAMLFARYYEPRNAAGVVPSPYGWYLEPGRSDHP
jgi:DNA-binding CsgD family transcriptional regulator